MTLLGHIKLWPRLLPSNGRERGCKLGQDQSCSCVQQWRGAPWTTLLTAVHWPSGLSKDAINSYPQVKSMRETLLEIQWQGNTVHVNICTSAWSAMTTTKLQLCQKIVLIEASLRELHHVICWLEIVPWSMCKIDTIRNGDDHSTCCQL